MGWWSGKKERAVLSPLEGYNLWAASYAEESNPIKNASDRFIEKFMTDLHGKNFLDAGCGNGKFCVAAQQQGAAFVQGIDLSPAMVALAQLQCPSGEFLCDDLTTVKLRHKHFDMIVCGLVLGHIKNLDASLDNLLNALHPEGVLLITDFHPFLTLQHARRTFRDKPSGRVYEIRHHLHLFQSYFSCFARHGMAVDVLEEPHHENTPVVFGMRIRKIRKD
ncbi:MAG TPA: class I SAM-dependent methyltransferase [Chryseolinea sp.]